MPLRATVDGNDIHAFEYSEDDWILLKESYKRKNLLMPCCASQAIPKTSKLGTFFFSHKQMSECNNAPESSEHIYLKALVAKAAVEAGWSASTENRGRSPTEDEWVADVLCKKGHATVAFEIQLSPVPYSDIALRTERYRQSKVRAAWLVGISEFKDWKAHSTKIHPIFGVNQLRANESPTVQPFDKPLNEFVKALLGKVVQWISEPWVYDIFYIEDTCWKCGNPVKQVYGSAIGVYGESAKTVPNASTILSKFSGFITNDELRSLGLNLIGKHEKLKGNAPGFPYCNVCIHCGAPQNNHHLMTHLQNKDREFGEAKFTSTRESTGKWIWLNENRGD